MTIYFKNKEKPSLIEMGKILTLSGYKENVIVTGDRYDELVSIATYDTNLEANEIFDKIINKITHPTAKEIEKDIIFIEL